MPRRFAPRQFLTISQKVKIGGVFWTKFKHSLSKTPNKEASFLISLGHGGIPPTPPSRHVPAQKQTGKNSFPPTPSLFASLLWLRPKNFSADGVQNQNKKQKGKVGKNACPTHPCAHFRNFTPHLLSKFTYILHSLTKEQYENI